MKAPSEIQNPKSEIVVAITGASGGRYALRLLDCLEASGRSVHLIVSPLGRQLLADECGVKHLEAEALIGRPSERIEIYNYRDVGCCLASGSFLTGGMVVCPCTSNTLGAIAAGLGDNLIIRAAHVTLKEARRLILVHREMPVSAIDLENMLRVQRAGGIICPAAPGFYMLPQTIGDLVDFVVGRVLDLLGVEHSLSIRWVGRKVQPRVGQSPET
jgi:4-hydroxy-3-polyprenylbenzoate decarboxylase